MPFLTLSRLERKRLSVFLTSLLIAILTWLFFALSNRYEYKVQARINYINPPVHKAYHPLHDDTLSLGIEGTGWQLVFSRLQFNISTIKVGLKELERKNYITLSSQIQDLNRQLEPGQKIIRVYPDTLFFDFSKRVSKKVPVKLKYQLTFRKAFGVSGPIKVSPDSVVISGAEEDLKKIGFWPTTMLSLNDLNSSVNTKVSLESYENNIDVLSTQVKVEIPVDEFTEKVVDLPIKVLNGKNRSVRVIPEKIKVIVLTALSNYEKVGRDSFQANVDLEEWMKHKYPQLPVLFSKFPAYSKLVRVEPQAVDFIVQD